MLNFFLLEEKQENRSRLKYNSWGENLEIRKGLLVIEEDLTLDGGHTM